MEPGIPAEQDGLWSLGPIALGNGVQTADILMRAHGGPDVRRLATGPADAVEVLGVFVGRR